MDRFAAAGSGRWLALFVVISGLGALNGWTLLVGELTRTMALQRRDAAGAGAQQPPRRAGRRAGRHRRVRQRHGADELQQVAGRRFHLPHQGRDRGQPAAVSVRSLALAVLWRRGDKAGVRGMLPVAVLGVAYVIFAFIGLGHEPFQLGVVLAAAGLPLYVFMRIRRSAAVA